MTCSYGLSLADGDDSMGESEQTSKQIFTREGKVYGRWRQLYPALLHLYVTLAFLRPPDNTHRSVHSNCQPDNDIVWEDPVNSERPRWGPFVTIARQYKWVWLNRGDGTATVHAETIKERKFWDELAFKEGFPRLNS
jgi:hypothetical protein